MNEIDELTEQVKEYITKVYQSGWSKGYEQGYRNGTKEYMETPAKPAESPVRGKVEAFQGIQHVGAEGIGSVPTPPDNRKSLPLCPYHLPDPDANPPCDGSRKCPPGYSGMTGCVETRESLTGACVKAAIPGTERTFTDKQGNRVRVFNPVEKGEL
jgi:hypothetical protein